MSRSVTWRKGMIYWSIIMAAAVSIVCPTPVSAYAPFSTGSLISDNVDGTAGLYMVDMDHDGDLDTIACSHYDDRLIWFENYSGDGSVHLEHQISNTVDGPESIHFGDIDQDGDIDVVSASIEDDRLVWHENTSGDGATWTSHTIATYNTTDEPFYVQLGDVDHDGDLDLVAVIIGLGQVVWQENTAGDGSAWTEHGVVTSADPVPRSLALGDIDGDGRLDIMVGFSVGASANRKVSWMENVLGDGTSWSENPVAETDYDSYFCVGLQDMDNDGDLDLVTTARYSLLNSYKVLWVENTVSGMTWIEHEVDVLNNTSDFSYVIIANDLDLDGDMDLLVPMNANGEVYCYENTGGGWSKNVAFSRNMPTIICTGDIDSDGDLDVVSSSSSQADNDIKLYRNDLSARSVFFSDTVAITDSTSHDIITSVMADIDHDGDPDFVYSTEASDSIYWFDNPGDGSNAWAELELGQGANYTMSAVTAGDINADGRIDIAAIAGTKVIWFDNMMSGGAVINASTISSSMSSPSSVALGDIDSDGNLDVLSAETAWHENAAGDGTSWLDHVNMGKCLRAKIRRSRGHGR